MVPLLGSALVIETSSRWAENGFEGAEYRASRRDDPQAIEAAREALTPWLVPISRKSAFAMLAELSVLTKRREGSDASEDLTMAVYASRLGRYPEDVVESVLRSWYGVFWPAWVELQGPLDRRVAPRLQFARALGFL